MYNKDSKRPLFLILIISALAHLILLILFLLSKLDDSVKQYKDLLQKKQKKEAQVIFKKPKQPKKRPPKKLTPKLVAGSPSFVPPVSAPKGATPGKPVPEKPKPTPKPKPVEETPEPKVKKKKVEPEKIEPQEEKPVSAKATSGRPVESKKELPKPIPKPKPTPRPNPPKPDPKKLTLADIAKGFMKYARQEEATRGLVQRNQSNHLVHIIGGKPGQATSEQLKHERYIKKLFDCLEVAFNLHARTFRFTTQIPHSDLLKILVHVDLYKTGQLASLQILEPSGNTQFDLLMEKVIIDAARSFPPVPTSFNTEIYSLPIQMNIATAILLPRRQPPMTT